MGEEVMVIYADILFLINFFIDGICLFISAVILKRPLKKLRYIFACFAGGIYPVVALKAEGLPTFVSAGLHLLAAAVICLIAFSYYSFKDTAKNIIAFFISTALLGGALYALYTVCGKFSVYNGYFYAELSPASLIPALLLCGGVTAVFAYRAKRYSQVRSAVLRLVYRGKSIEVDCLCDSGNLLLCPYSGRSVVLLKEKAFSEVFGAELTQRLAAGEIEQGFRFIPMNSVGGKILLPSFLPDEASVKPFGERREKTVSIAAAIDFSCGSYGGLDGLLPSSLL